MADVFLLSDKIDSDDNMPPQFFFMCPLDGDPVGDVVLTLQAVDYHSNILFYEIGYTAAAVSNCRRLRCCAFYNEVSPFVSHHPRNDSMVPILVPSSLPPKNVRRIWRTQLLRFGIVRRVITSPLPDRHDLVVSRTWLALPSLPSMATTPSCNFRTGCFLPIFMKLWARFGNRLLEICTVNFQQWYVNEVNLISHSITGRRCCCSCWCCCCWLNFALIRSMDG